MRIPYWELGLVMGIILAILAGVMGWSMHSDIWVIVVVVIFAFMGGFILSISKQQENEEKEGLRELLRRHKERGGT